MRPYLLLTVPVTAVLLTACGGPSAPATDLPPLPDPNPVNVTAIADDAQAASRLIPTEGGQIEVTDDRGTTYRLTLPSTALLDATEIVLTPLLSIEGSPIQNGELHGVRIEPSGLRLYDDARLEIVPPDRDTAEAVGFGTLGDGQQFHLAPLALDDAPGSATLRLAHFSEHGIFLPHENAPLIVDDPDTWMPSDWESALNQAMAELLHDERRAALLDLPRDPDWETKVEILLATYFSRVIEPLLTEVASDCGAMRQSGSKILAWSRSNQLVGLSNTFTHENEVVMDAVAAGADACWDEATGSCIDPTAPGYTEVLRTARMNLLLGGDEAVYDPERDDLRCGEGCAWLEDVVGWVGSGDFAWHEEGEGFGVHTTVHRTWSLTTELESHFGLTEITWTGGTDRPGVTTATYDVAEVVAAGDGGRIHAIGSGTPFSTSIYLTTDPASCTYHLRMSVEGDVHYYDNIDNSGTVDDDGTLVLSYVTVSTALPASPSLGGSTRLEPRENRDEQTGFTYGGTSASSSLEALRDGDVGTAAFDWSFEAVMEPGR